MAGHCILIIEDQQALLAGLQEILEDEGYAVLTATNGIEALRILQETQPDLIVADIMMPQMDGYAFYEEVRQRPEWNSIRFIFLTARASQDDILKGKALGVDGYITKPFDPQELLAVVRGLVDCFGN